MSISEETLARQRTVLAHYQQAAASLGYDTRLIETSGETPAPLLVIGVEQDAQGRDRMVHLTFLPFADGQDFDHLSLIQYYAALPFSVAPEYRSQMAELLIVLNNLMTIGYFGQTQYGNLYHRHVLVEQKWALLQPETIQQFLMVCVHMQNMFATTIESVATGQRTVVQALQ